MITLIKKAIYCLLPKTNRLKSKIIFETAGCVPNTKDSRDYAAPGSSGTNYPIKYSLREYCGVVENQGPYESCVAHAIADCIETLARTEGQKEVFELSRMHLWSIGRERTYGSAWQVNKGVYIRAAWDGLRKEAITIEKLFPYVEENAFSKPRSSFVFAWYPTDFKYYTIKEKDPAIREEKMKNALYNNKALVAHGIRLPKSISVLRIHTTPYKPKRGEFGVYSHAMTVVGWDDEKDAFLIKNSWGTRFGNSGFFWVDKQWFLENAFDLTYAKR